MAISLVVATPVGILSAARRNTAIDRFGTSFALFGICMPNFLIALLLIFVFGVTLRWLPISGYIDPWEEPLAGLRSLVLPAATLGLALAAVVTRTLRSSMLEALSEDYVRTARAKGLKSRRVLFKHSMRAALTPLVTLVGLDFAGLMGGAIITETVFNYNGLGKLAIDANNTNDLPTIIGLVLLLGTFVIVANIIVDVLYAVIDPRVRVG
jgi:peptide/nickel transport system permease protein